MIRVLIADESAAGREHIAVLIRTDSGLEVAGAARSGAETVELVARVRPNIVLLNACLLRGNGLDATKRIMIEHPTPIVILTDQANKNEVELSMHAMRAGALAVSPKPPFADNPAGRQSALEFLANVRSMSEVKLVRRWKERPSAESSSRGRTRPRIVAVAASTGGPAALQRILSDLPRDFPLPIVLVQHIAKGFVSGLVDWLNTTAALRVTLARQGELIEPGALYVAPDERHLGIDPDGRVLLAAAAPIGGFRPSATYLLGSVGHVYRAGAVAVMLTGMGQDGVDGLRVVRNAGGTVVVQDEATSAVFGMPRAAIESGLADAILPLPQIAPRLIALAH